MKSIKVILVEPTHPGNIGATARAMKNMGVVELVIVKSNFVLHEDAIARAAGAEDILKQAIVVESFNEAISDCSVVFATSSRERSLDYDVQTPRMAAENISKTNNKNKVAIVFGRESSGLTNEELLKCHHHIVIPTSETYSSLNLAQAVQIILYECRVTLEQSSEKKNEIEYANNDEVLGFFEHLEKVLIDIAFLDPNEPKQLMLRLTRLFNRAHLEKKEVNILRGILTAVEKH